jgi:fructokinase
VAGFHGTLRDATVERTLTIIGLGEALFDVFPDGRQVLGGAPLNAAVHAHQMAALLDGGGRGIPASRIGDDELGRRLVEELTARGVPTLGLQHDRDRPTGQVLVTLHGCEPSYEIVEDAAWDRIEFSADWSDLARVCDAVCFGTLAQRSPPARGAIERFLDCAPQAIRMFDVNLRQHYFSAELIRGSCTRATVVKLNELELPQVHQLLGLAQGARAIDDQAAALREHFGLEAVVLTRGAAGTALYTSGGKTDGDPVRDPPHPEADSVGAGDACAAGILIGMLLGWPAERIVKLANRAGAYVATQPGATPQLPPALFADLTGFGAALRSRPGRLLIGESP